MRARFRAHKRERERYETNGRNACVTYARDNFKSAARSGEMSQSVSKSNKLKVMEYRYRELNVIPGGITWDRIFFFFTFFDIFPSVGTTLLSRDSNVRRKICAGNMRVNF